MSRYQSTRIPKTERITKLVEHLYAKMPEIESARAILLTESFRQTENEPVILRRAKAFAHILKHIPIIIREGELIVGSSTIAPRGCQTFPEFSYEWMEAEFDTVATREADPFYISDQTKKELKEKRKNGVVYPSVAYELGAQIEELTGQEVRVTVPGHMQRGGEPCPYDRVLSTRVGAAAAKLIQNKTYGYMVCIKDGEVDKVPLEEVAGKLKTVDPKCSMIKEAKLIGICFGDE